MVAARFDDLADGSAFVLTGPLASHAAASLDQVRDVIAAAVEAAREGLWVAGYIEYGAAPAFDPALEALHDPTVPYAWFGVFEDRHDVAPLDPLDDLGGYSVSRWQPLVDQGGYGSAFDEVKAHIAAGDTYQVNLTFPLRAAFSGSTDAFYRDLVLAQEAGYACHLRHGGVEVVSVSPERFFAVDGPHIRTRPMKGTRRRGRWRAEDLLLRSELATSPKDRSENLMIVDLIRNDLGRIAAFGSVDVDELFAIEPYRTVWQMTSQVSADLADGVSLVDVFSALFPCGSVTGAPKARTMEIITEVEPYPRGVYCGAIGFIPPGDGLDGASFSVAIRTAVVQVDEGVVHYGVGGGVTWDSELGGEYDEALAKAVVLTTRPPPLGLLETLRWDGGWVWLDEHLARMEESAGFLGVDAPMDDIRSGLVELDRLLAMDAVGPTRVSVAVGPPAPDEAAVSIATAPAPLRFADRPGPDAETVTLEIDFDPVDERDMRLFHKTTDRSLYEARTRRHPGADDVIMTNRSGNVTETTIGNIVCLIDGDWVTPPVTDGLLPGIMRASLIADGSLKERSVSVPELLAADAIAVVNSVRGWRPAVVVNVPTATS
jgi:para-aminobenzoate synthetase/4-amino-4-deoxychorismate lyase